MATKIPVAQERLFRNVFVCRDCSTKVRAEARKIVEGKVRCRKCGKRHFRPIRKK
jgi:DNA-directed RNA polymerase subunit RPC12/RpoP